MILLSVFLFWFLLPTRPQVVSISLTTSDPFLFASLGNRKQTETEF